MRLMALIFVFIALVAGTFMPTSLASIAILALTTAVSILIARSA